MYALLDDVGARWVGFTRSVDGKRVVEVQGDRHFEANWGGVMNRRMIDGGQYERQSDGSYKTTDGEGIGGWNLRRDYRRSQVPLSTCIEILSNVVDGGERILMD